MGSEHFDIGVLGAGSATETLARELDGTGRSVVVFEPDDQPKLDPLSISSRIPDKGDRVWVLALAAEGDSLVHAARFERAEGDWLHIRMDEPPANTSQTIGGAVVNSDLAVIGVKVADFPNIH